MPILPLQIGEGLYIWSDEYSVERGKGVRPVQLWYTLTEQLREHDIHAIRIGKGIKQIFQAGFTHNRRTGLVPLDGDPHSRRGGVISLVISNIYQAYLPDFIQLNDIFIHDNTPVHTAAIIKRILAELGIEVMLQPLYSPDLNPIENLQAIMKNIIYERYPELKKAPDNQDTLNRLVKAAKEAWHAIDERVLYSFQSSYPPPLIYSILIIRKCDPPFYTKA